MELKVLKTKKDYNDAVSMLEALGDDPGFEQNPDLVRQFELLSALIEKYESEHAPVPAGNPIDIILLKMDYMGLKRKDIITCIGSSGLVSDVLNKKRALSKSMIRKLAELLQLDQNLLNQPYELIAPQRSKKTTGKTSTSLFAFINTVEVAAYKAHVHQYHSLMPLYR